MSDRSTHYRRRSPDNLTPRQREVVDLMARGLTNGEIAARLGISLEGAKYHVTEILTRLEVSSREDAVRVWRGRSRWKLSRDRLARAFVIFSPLKVGAGAAVVFAGVVGAMVLLPFASGDERSSIHAQQLPRCVLSAAEVRASVSGSVHHDSTYIHVYAVPDAGTHGDSCRVDDSVSVLLTDASGMPLPILGNGSEAGVHGAIRWWDGRFPSGTSAPSSADATGVVVVAGAEAAGALDVTRSDGLAWTNWCGDREDGSFFLEVRHGDEVSIRRSIAPPLCSDPARQSRLAPHQ